jgi:serine/threonine protein kinase
MDLCLIFRFTLNNKFPQSPPSRIVTCYHGLPVNDVNETFSDRASMRKALYSSIRRVWPQCILHPSITAVDATVEIYEDTERQDQWRVSHESVYKLYIESLLPMSRLFACEEVKPKVYDSVDYSSLIQIRHLGGRGSTTVVRRSLSSDSLYIFKGVDFRVFLESRADFRHRRDICYHEIRTICALPGHPNIIPPPSVFVTAKRVEDQRQVFVCGTLYPFMEHGTLDDQVEKSKTTGTRLGLIDKAVWCFQMASAISHAHFTAHTFHMDIKPANFILDPNKDLVLIDWEQSGAPLYTLAPEADGSWDVEELAESSLYEGPDFAAPKLLYKKYHGPPRENLAWGRPKWNVFPIWRDHCPRALEAAEVFSLGRTMWMLLQQVAQSEVEDLDEVVLYWNEEASDIPDDWKVVISSCLDPDPNRRIRLSELVRFWGKSAPQGSK